MKYLYVICLTLFSIYLSQQLSAQTFYFSSTPAQSMCVSASTNAATFSVMAAPIAAVSFSWAAVNTFCLPNYGLSSNNGSTCTVIFQYYCCGTHSIYCYAYDNLNNLLATAINTFTLFCAPNTAITTSSNAAANANLCAGTTVTLSATGANSYTWNGPGITGLNNPTLAVTPSVSACYSVSGINSIGCRFPSVSCLTVVPLPTLTVSGSTNVCIGSSNILNASGASTYTWNNGSNNASILVTPTNTTTYSVTGTSSASCTNSASISLYTNACLEIGTYKNKTSFLSLFPNPCSSILNIGVPESISSDLFTLRILNSFGETIKEESLNLYGTKAEITIEDLPEGVYLLHLKSDSGTMSKPFVIER